MNDNVINKRLFGRKIRDAREKLNLTQAELAEKVDISPNFLGDIERGIKLPSLNKLICLSNVLKISLDTMFADSLDNMVSEPDDTYYTDRQMSIIKSLISTINNNF